MIIITLELLPKGNKSRIVLNYQLITNPFQAFDKTMLLLKDMAKHLSVPLS